MGTREAALENLDKATMSWHRPRPWRSAEESEMIRRLAFWWFRAWARGSEYPIPGCRSSSANSRLT